MEKGMVGGKAGGRRVSEWREGGNGLRRWKVSE